MSDEQYWKTFLQREAQRYQEQAERSRQIAEIEAAKKKQSDEYLALLERERQTVEKRHTLEQQATKMQSAEQVLLKVEVHQALLQQLAKEQALADLQRNEAIRIAAQKLQEEVQKTKGNPMEIAFQEAWKAAYPDIELIYQYHIGRYRVDFAHVETKTVIELDGHLYHSSKKDRNKDYARHIEIEDLGWYIIRFTGSQIFTNIESCIQTTWKRIQDRMAR